MKKYNFNIINIFLFPVYILAIFSLYLYKLLISPFLTKTCKFFPTCSTYMLQSIKEFGIIKGIYLGLKRLLKCNSFSKCWGYDPVPDNVKGGYKWLI